MVGEVLMVPALDGVQDQGNYLRAFWHNALIVIWKKVEDGAIPKVVADIELLDRRGAGVTYLSIIPDLEERPSPDFFRKMGQAITAQSASRRFLAIAVVFEATGLRSSVARITFNTVNMVVPGVFPKKGVNSVAEAARVLAPYLRTAEGGSVTAQELQAAVQQLRSLRPDAARALSGAPR